MSDDTFIREVNEEMRQDRARDLWRRYGRLLIALAVVFVLVIGGWQGWVAWQERRAAASGDLYLAAQDHAEAGRTAEATAGFQTVMAEGTGDYPALAELRLAGLKSASGDKAGAIAAFDAVAARGGIDPNLRAIARLRAGLLAVDVESRDQVKARLDPLAGPGEPQRALAREGLALAALKAGDAQGSADLLQRVVDDAGSPGNVRNRARILLEMLAGRGIVPARG